MWIQRTLPLLRKALVTIPRLSPTQTKAKIYSWGPSSLPPTHVECSGYDVFFILQCSPDLVSQEHRVHSNHEPRMLIEAHEEGTVKIYDSVQLDKWYDVGEVIGEIDDGDEEDDSVASEWIWQGYTHNEEEKG
jgi:hypothetical protein